MTCAAALAEPDARGEESAAKASGGAPSSLVLPAAGTRLSEGAALEVFKIVPATQAPPARSAAGPAETAASDQQGNALETAQPPAAGGESTASGTATAADSAAPPPEPTLVIDVNLTSQRMTVTENGVAKHTWMISSAALGYRTPTGTFKPSWMARMWYSRQYDWSPMPHAIFFHNGVAIHATQALRQLGRPASHGCVRLAPGNARTLYKMVSTHGKDMTRIVVHGSPRFTPTASRVNGYGYRQAGRRAPGAYYGYYGAPPSYYAPAQKRRATAYAYQKPRKYVSRGLAQGPYGY